MLSNCTAIVERLVYTDKVSQKQEVWRYPAYLTAVSEYSKVIEAGAFGKSYKLSIQAHADIQEADTVIIDDIIYKVKAVAHRSGGCTYGSGWLLLTTVILELWV